MKNKTLSVSSGQENQNLLGISTGIGSGERRQDLIQGIGYKCVLEELEKQKEKSVLPKIDHLGHQVGGEVHQHVARGGLGEAHVAEEAHLWETRAEGERGRRPALTRPASRCPSSYGKTKPPPGSSLLKSPPS